MLIRFRRFDRIYSHPFSSHSSQKNGVTSEKEHFNWSGNAKGLFRFFLYCVSHKESCKNMLNLWKTDYVPSRSNFKVVVDFLILLSLGVLNVSTKSDGSCLEIYFIYLFPTLRMQYLHLSILSIFNFTETGRNWWH